MNIKITYILLFIINIVTAFFAGKYFNDYKFLQNNLNSLIIAINKQTGVNLSFQTTDYNYDKLITQAEAKLKQGDVTNASLYFSNLIAQHPGDWSLLQKYYSAWLNYAQDLIKDKNFAIAISIINDIENFLRIQSIYVKPSELENLEQYLINLADLQQQVNAMRSAQISQENIKQFNNLNNAAENIINNNSETESLENLQKLLENLKQLDTSDLNESQNTELHLKITACEQQLAIQQTKNFIKLAQQESISLGFVLNYLYFAENTIRQLILTTPDSIATKQQIAQLINQLDLAKETIAQTQSKNIWQVIEDSYAKIKIEIEQDIKKHDILIQLLNFKKLLSQNLVKLSSLKFQEQAQNLLEEINKKIEETQNSQLYLYNLWAIDVIQKFYGDYKKELGIGTDTKKVYIAILANLASIDTRYLSIPVQTAYNEAFNIFYQELDSHRKISLSAEMAVQEKKKLEDF